MNDRERIELERLAADIRDDLARAQYMGEATVGTWMLMSYAERLEKLVRVMEEGEWPSK
ncbi:hypothetical protein [Chromohalobacter sp. 48-RD10]|uniref:hypothetical protein n=1 Tax=Chromohalobacter sp. 48-RD10 TaxID=2994063 RepID=UPI002469BC9F|nr:hypothetical protein [Chromohalobacter sp. 48-RD10]